MICLRTSFTLFIKSIASYLFLNSLLSLPFFYGAQVRLILVRFLPGVFMDAMRDNAEAAVHIFEGTHENPELIWNDSSRETVSTTVREMMLE